MPESYSNVSIHRASLPSQHLEPVRLVLPLRVEHHHVRLRHDPRASWNLHSPFTFYPGKILTVEGGKAGLAEQKTERRTQPTNQNPIRVLRTKKRVQNNKKERLTWLKEESSQDDSLLRLERERRRLLTPLSTRKSSRLLRKEPDGTDGTLRSCLFSSEQIMKQC